METEQARAWAKKAIQKKMKSRLEFIADERLLPIDNLDRMSRLKENQLKEMAAAIALKCDTDLLARLHALEWEAAETLGKRRQEPNPRSILHEPTD